MPRIVEREPPSTHTTQQQPRFSLPAVQFSGDDNSSYCIASGDLESIPVMTCFQVKLQRCGVSRLESSLLDSASLCSLPAPYLFCSGNALHSHAPVHLDAIIHWRSEQLEEEVVGKRFKKHGEICYPHTAALVPSHPMWKRRKEGEREIQVFLKFIFCTVCCYCTLLSFDANFFTFQSSKIILEIWSYWNVCLSFVLLKKGKCQIKGFPPSIGIDLHSHKAAR